MANERVLIVDDSLVYRDLILNYVLEPNGYRPLVAQNGKEGLNKTLQEQPDLVIMDMEMPKMTGMQVLEALYEVGNQIPVVLMTLHGSEELVVQAFRLGVKDYVIKPFEVEEMLAVMDRALTEVRLRRERDALTHELMRVNEQLESERRQLETVLTSTEDAVLVIGDGAADRVILCNEAVREAFCIDCEVVGQPVAEVVRDNVLLNILRRAKADKTSVQAEIPLSDERTLNVHVTPIPGVGRVAVMQDITHLKELDRVKTELVSTVSHDLRSPLTSIRGFADLIPMVGELNEQQTYFLQKIQRGVANVTEMVSDLLDLGRIEAEARMEMEPCDVGEIAEKAAESHQNQAELRGQSLQIERDPEPLLALGNPLRLGQAISNLVGNAVKYTPEQGRISVSATSQSGQIVLTVEDNGIGIPVEDQPHVFKKFYRVKGPETDAIVGSGLGLSLVKSIIDKHQGRIWVRSHVGVGSAFTIVLPVLDEHDIRIHN